MKTRFILSALESVSKELPEGTYYPTQIRMKLGMDRYAWTSNKRVKRITARSIDIPRRAAQVAFDKATMSDTTFRREYAFPCEHVARIRFLLAEQWLTFACEHWLIFKCDLTDIGNVKKMPRNAAWHQILLA